MLYNGSKMIVGFVNAGYELVDSWEANELWFRLPGFPEYNVPAHTGLFFRHITKTS